MTIGLYSIALLIGMIQGLIVAMLLVLRRRNWRANRLLAALLLLFVVTLVPSTIGFAGAYDSYPWLMFAPFSVTLGFGPMLWLYVHRLLRGRMPRSWAAHLLPLLIQVAYFAVLFTRPLQWRYEYNAATHGPIVSPIETLASLVSACCYWIAAGRLYHSYRRWAPQHVSDSENYSLQWLRNFLLATALGFVTWAGFEIVDEAITPLSYRAFFWLDLLAAILLYAFAIAGYRHADLRWPAMGEHQNDERPSPAPSLSPDAPRPTDPPTVPNWSAQAEMIRERLSTSRWYLQPDLTLESLARHLATNTWSLSRAINEGAQCNFNDFVNAFRVEAVKDRLRDPNESRTLLEIALACGFNSKTSFNRSFKKLAGQTPTQWRKLRLPGAEILNDTKHP